MTRQWLIVIAIAVLLFIVAVAWGRSRVAEGFVTVDADTAKAQRQQLQFEGERRYNDLARLQASSSTLDPDTIQAAIQTQVAVPTSKTPSLLDFLSSNLGLGAADNGSGKQGAWVEQTGVVAQKIAFCESLGTDCSALQNPAAAECGICLNGGTDSTGKPHRGGLFISSDDQLRKGFGEQTPTIGSCPAANFVTDPTWCGIRSNELSCELKSVLSDSDQCGMCYGGASAGKSGLVYMGPKGQKFDATLAISHPGFHADGNGNSFTVARADGTVIVNLQASIAGTALDPKAVTLPGISEGDQLVITIRGAPVVWAGYIANAKLNRYFSLDVGIQGITPAGAFEVAGDAYSSMVTNVMNGLPAWPAYQADLPRTVMWFQRQSTVVPAPIIGAMYGSPNGQVDVINQLAKVAGTGTGLIVSQGVNAANIGTTDPDPTTQKNLFLTQDDGNTLVYHDNTQVDPSKFQNTVTIYFTVPATLVDPTGPTDMADCATGPIITTTTGLGLFGAHSCYNPDGSPNLSVGCLTELYQGAGGQAAGTLNPSGPQGTAPLLAAVATKLNKTQDALTIDDITNFLGLQNDIVLYQADQYGNPVTFTDIQNANQYLLGRTPGNPCDTPTATTGPHSVECLDYLWRTSGNVGAEPTLPKGDPTQLPYQFCTVAGTAAPYTNGKPNQTNINAANAQGGMSQVRAYYNAMYKAATNPPPGATPDQINAALQACMGTNYVAPPPIPFTQCAPEVFQVVPNTGYTATQNDAAAVCAAFGATVATTAQLQDAYGYGAEWCSAGWVQDDTQNAYYPMQSAKSGCGNSTGIQNYMAQWLPNQKAGTGLGLGNGDPTTALAGVNCYGVKPPQGTADVQPFNESSNTWNAPMMPKAGMTVSIAPITNVTAVVSTFFNSPGVSPQIANIIWTGTPGSTTGVQDPAAGTFKIIPANNNDAGYVSFESVANPGYFICISGADMQVYLQQGDATDSTFQNNSSFGIVAPVYTGAGSSGGFSIQPYSYPNNYLIAYDYGIGKVTVGPDNSSSAVWKLVPALTSVKNLSS